MKKGTSRSGTLKKANLTRQSAQIRVTLSDVTSSYTSVPSLLNSDQGLDRHNDNLQGYQQNALYVPTQFTAVAEKASDLHNTVRQEPDDNLNNNIVDTLSSDTICVARSAQNLQSRQRESQDRGAAMAKKRAREAVSPNEHSRMSPACPKRHKSYLEGIAGHVSDPQPARLPQILTETSQSEMAEEDVQLVTQSSVAPASQPPVADKTAVDITESSRITIENAQRLSKSSRRTIEDSHRLPESSHGQYASVNHQANRRNSQGDASRDDQHSSQPASDAFPHTNNEGKPAPANKQLESPLLADWKPGAFHDIGPVSLGYLNKEDLYRTLYTGEINPAVLQHIRNLYMAKKPGYFEVLRLWPQDNAGDAGLPIPHVEVGENGPYDHVDAFFQQPELLKKCGKGNAEFVVEPVVFRSPWRNS